MYADYSASVDPPPSQGTGSRRGTSEGRRHYPPPSFANGIFMQPPPCLPLLAKENLAGAIFSFSSRRFVLARTRSNLYGLFRPSSRAGKLARKIYDAKRGRRGKEENKGGRMPPSLRNLLSAPFPSCSRFSPPPLFLTAQKCIVVDCPTTSPSRAKLPPGRNMKFSKKKKSSSSYFHLLGGFFILFSPFSPFAA